MITAKQANELTFNKAYIMWVDVLAEQIEKSAKYGRSNFRWEYNGYLNEKVLEQIKATLRNKGFTIKDITPSDYKDYGFENSRVFDISWE